MCVRDDVFNDLRENTTEFIYAKNWCAKTILAIAKNGQPPAVIFNGQHVNIVTCKFASIVIISERGWCALRLSTMSSFACSRILPSSWRVCAKRHWHPSVSSD